MTDTRIEHLVFFSGGIGSWAAAKRLALRDDVDALTLLFSDTQIEDEDLYRFLDDAVANIRKTAKVDYVTIADGRDPWQVFEDVGFIGNTRIDPCSRILKRELMDTWRDEHCDSEHTTLYYGIDWTETHRIERVRERLPAWRIEAPMTERPSMNKPQMLAWAKDEGIEPPRLYKMGFAHNNCGGFCIKSGQAQFERLLKTMPERYKHHEQREAEVAEKIGTDATILRDRTRGTTTPLSLRQFRENLEAQPDLFDHYDFGGCGCAMD